MRAFRSIRNLVLAAIVVAIPFAVPTAAHARVFVSVGVAPPILPYYAQPLCPGPGYIWTPGYWAYGDEGYSWVDGAWVLAPYEGALWTPGWWGWGGGFYNWYPGYWGRRVGYYGGINYGFGYFGVGFYGGYWRGHDFFYNSAYSHVGVGFHNIYSGPVNGIGVHPGGASFNGPRGVESAHPAGFDANHGVDRGSALASAHSNTSAQGFHGNATANTTARSYSRPANTGGSYSQSRSYSASSGSYQSHSYQSSAPRSYSGGSYGGGSRGYSGGGRSSGGGGSRGGGHR